METEKNYEKHWHILNEYQDAPETSNGGYSQKVLTLLKGRGIDTENKIDLFFNGGLDNLYSPFLFEGMHKAVDRISRAINEREAILVYGDRDVDGITSVNIVADTIRLVGGIVQWYVPAGEGYGLHKDIISQYAENDIKVLITVDCGICAKEEIAYASSLAIDVVLTDHHQPVDDMLAAPYVCINPKLKDTKYPFNELAGCGVALKLSQGILMAYQRQYDKQILMFSADNAGGAIKGKWCWGVNDVYVEPVDFDDIKLLEQEVQKAWLVYTQDKDIADIIISNNASLKSKFIILDGPDIKADSYAKRLENLILAKARYDLQVEGLEDFYKQNLDICALGTIADSVPLVDENRIIVKEGLKALAQNPLARPGLGLLIEDTLKTKTSYNINAQSISWLVTPVLNSAGRMGRGSLSAQALMTRDKFQAQILYTDIIKLNADRKFLQNENIWLFKNLLKQQCDLDKDKVLIVRAANIEHGVTGLIATFIMKAYSRPVFLLISNDSQAIGAVRSVEGFNIIEALDNVKDILIKYGGHNQAAGFTIENSRIEEFKQRMLDYADKTLVSSEFRNSLMIDMELMLKDVNIEFLRQVEEMAPFGFANDRPVFCIRGVAITEVYAWGAKKEYIKFKVMQKGSKEVSCIIYNRMNYSRLIKKEEFYDIAFHIGQTERNGAKSIQLTVIDIKYSY
jgi:single-stranded-DNA-specific exonuclease